MGHGHHTHQHLAPNAAMSTLARRATYASVVMALLLLTAKTIAWWTTESLSMLSSLTDSLFDLLSSIVNMFALRYALKPADDDHRFGHTSIEDIAGLTQCAFISASMLLIILQSVERLYNPHPLAHESIGIAVSVAAMLATTLLVAFQTYAAKKTGSLIVASDRLHYAGDVLFNLGVLIALFISSRTGITWIDPAMAIVIAVVVLWSSRTIGIRAFHNLMDREMPNAEKANILTIIQQSPGILGHHNLKTRYSGNKAFIQMHAEVDAALGFQEAHDIIDRLERSLLGAFAGAEVIIHPDPLQKPKPARSGDYDA